MENHPLLNHNSQSDLKSNMLSSEAAETESSVIDLKRRIDELYKEIPNSKYIRDLAISHTKIMIDANRFIDMSRETFDHATELLKSIRQDRARITHIVYSADDLYSKVHDTFDVDTLAQIASSMQMSATRIQAIAKGIIQSFSTLKSLAENDGDGDRGFDEEDDRDDYRE